MLDETDAEEDFLSYAKHCEAMANSATTETDKALWLRMAAAWRRRMVPRTMNEDPSSDAL